MIARRKRFLFLTFQSLRPGSIRYFYYDRAAHRSRSRKDFRRLTR